MDAADRPRRRAEDHGLRARVRAFWDRWGQLITGIWLIMVSTGLILIAIQFYSGKSATDTAARVACDRGRKFGPPLADYYARENVFTQEQLAEFRALIPTKCPKP